MNVYDGNINQDSPGFAGIREPSHENINDNYAKNDCIDINKKKKHVRLRVSALELTIS